MNRNLNEDKIMGALVGFSIGDAMGATTEFMTKSQIKEKYGYLDEIIGGGWLGLEAGEVTDDTQMMLCVIESLLEVGLNPSEKDFFNAVSKRFIDWYMSNPKDIGNTCRRGIEHLIETGKPIGNVPDSLGNGGLMRALPLALVGNEKLNIIQNDITHNNNACRKFLKIYIQVIDDCLNDANLEIPTFLNEPSGHVINTLYNACYYSLGCNDFMDAITEPVNDGGDADTIAAISGGIAGLRFGLGEIPYRWVDKLDGSIIDTYYRFARLILNS